MAGEIGAVVLRWKLDAPTKISVDAAWALEQSAKVHATMAELAACNRPGARTGQKFVAVAGVRTVAASLMSVELMLVPSRRTCGLDGEG